MLKDLDKKSFDFYNQTKKNINKSSFMIRFLSMIFAIPNTILSKKKFIPVLDTSYDILVKKISQEEFNNILTTVKHIMEEEVKALTKAYWIFYFAYHNGHSNQLDLAKGRFIISKQINTVKNFYILRLKELNTAYDLIQNDKTELVKFTHDKGNPIQKIITWKSYQQNEIITFLKDSEDIINLANKYISKPNELKEFLHEHNEDILNGYPVI